MISKLVTRFWPFILVVSLAVGGLSLIPTIKLYKKISTDPVDLLPPNHPNVQTLLRVREAFQERTRIGIVLESPDPDKTIAYMKELAGRLRNLPFVYAVHDRKAGYDFFDRNKLLFLDREDLQTIRDRIDRRIQQEKLGGFLIDLDDEEDDFNFGDLETKYRGEYSEATRSEYYTSDDKTLFSLYVESKEKESGLKATSAFYDQLTNFLKNEAPSRSDPQINLYLAGPTKVLEYRALIRDLKIAGLISALCLFIPVLIRFRNPAAVLLIFTPLFLGIPTSFAVGSLFVDRLSVTTSFLFAILGGLGIESGIHLFSRYYSLRSTGRPVTESIDALYHELGRAILTSVASVAITFLLLIVNDFRGFSEFGLIASIGLWILFLLYFSFFPALMIFAEKIGLLKIKIIPSRELPFPKRSLNWLRPALLLFAVYSLYSVASPFWVGFEYDSKKIRADIPEIRIAKEKQRKTSSRVNNPAVLTVGSRKEAEALRLAFRERKRVAGDKTTLDTTRSYYDLLPADQEEKMKLIGEMKEMLSDPTIKLVKGENRKKLDEFRAALGQTSPFTEEAVPSELAELMRGSLPPPKTLFFVNALPHLELDDGRNAIRFAEETSEIKTSFGTYHPSSDASIFGIVLQTMFQDVPRIIFLSLLAVIFFVALDFRSIRETVLVVTSIVMGVFWLMGVMTLFGLRLNFYNMVILPSVMGMSIDNAIHIVHRYRELGRGSLREVLKGTGGSCLLSSLTNAGGFAGLLFTTHKGLFSMGLLAVLGIGTCLLSTLVFLPIILKLLEIRELKKAF